MEDKIKLRPYQQKLYDEIKGAIGIHKKILGQAETGWGKSILIGKLANNIPGRTLVLTHRIELLNQNSEWINDLGILTAKVKKIQQIKDCTNVISMAQTCRSRFNKYGADYIGEFDTVICDEIHVDFFKDVYNLIPNATVIAVTATPIINKKDNKILNGEELVRILTLADEFDVLFQGIKTSELIKLGYLTQDFNIALTPPNLEKLKESNTNPDGYTSKSLTDVFGSNASIETVMKGYKEFCSSEANNGIAKKTLIFNPTTKVNKTMYDAFLDEGIECKLYDSVNEINETRQEITEWFINTPGAILLNVGVFTTGFSVNDLEAIIYNKKTKSLSLWLQSAGRGSRILTDSQIKNGQIKQNFLMLDCGLNIETHGRWSLDRDWQDYFVKKKWKLKEVCDLMSMWECHKCGHWSLDGSLFLPDQEIIVCEKCKEPKKIKERQQNLIEGDFVILEEPIMPQARKIIDYVKRVGGDKNMALQIARNQILDLFRFYTTKEDYLDRKDRYNKRIASLYMPVYFACLNEKNLKGANKKLETETNRIKKSINKLYNL
tara:strand:- start:1399 stop:3045 length:1647 start_codon:yes stop_codon:yes gene_type:complete